MLSDFISEEKLKLDSKIEDLHSTSQANLVQDAWMLTVLHSDSQTRNIRHQHLLCVVNQQDFDGHLLIFNFD